MPIISDFRFGHQLETAHLRAAAPIPFDFRGDLVQFLAGFTQNAQWDGQGFNLIWRPDFIHHDNNPNDFFLELNETKEKISFLDITGSVPGVGIANRGALQRDIQLGGIAYTQEVKDANEPDPAKAGLHFEPGVWINVESTTSPPEPASISRMGSIPHGTTINLQGVSRGSITDPGGIDMTQIILPASITPSQTDPNDNRNEASLVPFPQQEQIDSNNKDAPSRTKISGLRTVDQAHLTNPNLYLLDALSGKTVTKLTTLVVSSDKRDIPGGKPDVGGGIANIAFLQGSQAPNANAVPASAIFWFEEGLDATGQPFRQLQYTQRVLMKFNALNWPHISVATLMPTTGG